MAYSHAEVSLLMTLAYSSYACMSQFLIYHRYGPPPSYPHLKVPGLNAPIPEGCSFGYHAGGWGKPPVDEFGRPLYGDVFGITSGDAAVSAMLCRCAVHDVMSYWK